MTDKELKAAEAVIRAAHKQRKTSCTITAGKREIKMSLRTQKVNGQTLVGGQRDGKHVVRGGTVKKYTYLWVVAVPADGALTPTFNIAPEGKSNSKVSA